MTREPLLTTGAITAVAAAVLALLVAFGLPLNDDEQAGVLGVLAAVVPLAVAFHARGKVTPVAAPEDDLGRPLTFDPLGPVSAREEKRLLGDAGNVDISLILLVWCAVALLLLLLGITFR